MHVARAQRLYVFPISKAARPARYALFAGFAVRALGGLDPSALLIAADLDVFGCLEVRTPTSLHVRLLDKVYVQCRCGCCNHAPFGIVSFFMCSDRGVRRFKIHGLIFLVHKILLLMKRGEKNVAATEAEVESLRGTVAAMSQAELQRKLGELVQAMDEAEGRTASCICRFQRI